MTQYIPAWCFSILLTGAGISFLGNSFLNKFSLHNRCFTSEALHTRFALRAKSRVRLA